jgi:hybrid polyketide synthase/nonribosomal peptide synthetase ACE1
MAQGTPLYVGSIKTVIGHTEGTAGLAAVLKASLALQHAVIPPNLLLNELNPTVRPYYKDLLIASSAQKWPELQSQVTRRASVNSFGFGGANAHAILEAYDNPAPCQLSKTQNSLLTPFNFSASTEKSLLATLRAFATYLQGRSNVDLHDLSWTLNCRRSTLPVRVSICASSVNELTARLDKAADAPSEISPATKTSSINKPQLLGIFTGQGAQWARMGGELLQTSSLAAECIVRLDLSLQALPEEDRPLWSLKDEILKDARSSRISEALFSQTLCTAVQVMLVDLLRGAGIFFTAVVGHSSGEIAAAYAAGYLSSEDAIRIAYYRGWSLQNTPDRMGDKGAMLAVGTSLEDAKELCEMPTLEGRICVAASNSSASVTLSGDADAIEEAKEIFEDEKKFARILKVDKAYHSYHMIPCAAPYIEAIQRCGIRVQNQSTSNSKWFSSVYSKNIDDVNDNLTDTYWSNNMINPVMFSQAVSFAVAAAGPFDFALEVGPHPALKGPVLQTIQEVSGKILPYSGVLSRGKGDAESFASALGALWVSLGQDAVDFANFESKATSHTVQPRLLKGIPAYSWDHDRIYWHESRISTTFRAGNRKFHPLLGTKCPDGTDMEVRWRNYLNPHEIPWLTGHQVQGQIVFPAAGYVSAAIEMAVEQHGLELINMIEFQDVIIGQALVLEENSGAEVIFALAVTQNNSNTVKAIFSCYSDANKGSSSMSLHASAQLHIFLGEPTRDALPPPSVIDDSFLELGTERFYNSVSELGFGYTGPFRALSGLRRKMDEAVGMIAVPFNDTSDAPLVVHPASLDAAIQSIMLAYCFPGDGRLRNLYLPTKIDRIRINPSSCAVLARRDTDLHFYSSVVDARFAELSGDVDIFSADGRYTVVQLQGLHTTPLSPLSAATDVTMFTELIWAHEEPTGRKVHLTDLLKEELSQSMDFERVAHFYLKDLHSSFQQSDHSEIAWHHQHFLSYVNHCVSLVASGSHPFARPQWAHDTKELISGILGRYVKVELL